MVFYDYTSIMLASLIVCEKGTGNAGFVARESTGTVSRKPDGPRDFFARTNRASFASFATDSQSRTIAQISRFPLRATLRAYYENSRSPAISCETDACLTSHFHNFHLHLYSLIILGAKFPKHNDVYVIIPRGGMSTHAATVHSRAHAHARADSAKVSREF
jgi:hypothetical protein